MVRYILYYKPVRPLNNTIETLTSRLKVHDGIHIVMSMDSNDLTPDFHSFRQLKNTKLLSFQTQTKPAR